MRLVILGGATCLIAGTAVALKHPKVSPWSPLLPLEAPICINPDFWKAPEPQPPAGEHGSSSGWEGLDTCNRDACIFSNSDLGGGLVLVTSPRNAEIISDFPAPPRPRPAPLPFDVAHVPGKGVGLIANREIRAGEIIMVRPPTMIVQTAAHVGLDPEPRDMLYDRAMARLPGPKRALFLGQMGRDVHDKIETNCFQLFVDGENESGSHLACYPEVSRFNHDCRPK